MSIDTELSKRDDDAVQEIQQKPAVSPAVDIFENEDEYLVIADLPGATENDIKIDLHRGELSLQASRHIEEVGDTLSWEFEPAGFRRAFRVPDIIDAAAIKAEFKAGVLWLHLPKSAEVKPRSIEVRAG